MNVKCPLTFVFPHNDNGIIEGVWDPVVVSDANNVEVVGFCIVFEYFVAFAFQGIVDGSEGYFFHSFLFNK
jgi:hypothetical protein